MAESIVIGTAGHVDHGKTELVRALTGVDADRLEEEKRRGITIDLGFAHTPIDDGRVIAFVDVPGHNAFIRNMVAGASGIDAALLVIAADEGVMPQTREHLEILRFLGVARAVVAITKVDLVEDDWLELVRAEVRELLRATPHAAATLCHVSARTGQGIEQLRTDLARITSVRAAAASDDLFRMPVDRAFTVHGTGTVVTGTVWHGALAIDQEVTVLPSGTTARVRALQQHHQPVESIGAGERAAVALAGIERDSIRRGQVLVSGASWRASRVLTAQVTTVPEHALAHGDRLRVHVGTAELMARVALLDGDAIQGGSSGLAQLRLERPTIVRACDRIVLRSFSPVTTIGGGIVIEPLGPRRARASRGVTTLHDALGDPGRMLLALTAAAGMDGVDRSSLPIRLGASPAIVAGAEDQPDVLPLVDRIFARAVAAPLRQRIVAQVAAYHRSHPLRPGIPHAELVAAHPFAHVELLEHVLEAALAQELRLDHGAVALSDYRMAPDPEQQQALERLTAVYLEVGLASPALDALPPQARERPDLSDLLAFLQRNGTLTALGEERWLHTQHVSDLEKRVRQRLAGRSGLTPADFRDCIPLSRKHLIPLLEFLDGRGVTRRQGETRSVEP